MKNENGTADRRGIATAHRYGTVPSKFRPNSSSRKGAACFDGVGFTGCTKVHTASELQ